MSPDQMTLPLVFLSGILGSAHCIGMCGGIAATMSLGASGLRAAIVRQFVWSLGRTLTYGFLGMVAATAGARILRADSNAVWAQSLFAIIAGLMLVIQGLISAGWLSRTVRKRSSHPCLSASLLSQFLRGGSAVGVFVAGLATGFLPCGLVYSFLALAASSGHVGPGLLIMLCFGLGTIPVMVLTGTGFSLAAVTTRQQLLKLAAISVVVTGVMTLGRGIVFAHQGIQRQEARERNAAQSCPICVTRELLQGTSGASETKEAQAPSVPAARRQPPVTVSGVPSPVESPAAGADPLSQSSFTEPLPAAAGTVLPEGEQR
jgi:sulfite exporter TauE/SafE